MQKPKIIDTFNTAAEVRHSPYYRAWEMERFNIEDLEQAMPWHIHYSQNREKWGVSLESQNRLFVRFVDRLYELREKHLAQFPDFYTAGHSRLTELYADLDKLTADERKDGNKLAETIRPYIKQQTLRPNPLLARTDWPKAKPRN